MARHSDDTRSVSRRDLLRGGSIAAVAAATGGYLGPQPAFAQAAPPPVRWDREVDVVVVGAGATGMPAAIVAREAGNSVVVIEAEADVGGHAICSGGNLPLGGGTSVQKAQGITDSPDLVYGDLTDWSVVSANGFPDYRYNDREIIRAFADNSAPTFEFLLAHGVERVDIPLDGRGGNSVGNSVARSSHCRLNDWVRIQTGKQGTPEQRKELSTGIGLIRPLEAAARKLGVEILLEHRMTALYREKPRAGSVLGIAVDNKGKQLNIRARKAVILGTGGSTSNVNFRRMFDPRLTEEYCGVAGTPWSYQDGSGEIAAMDIGASLWGLYNNTAEIGSVVTKPGAIGTQFGYVNLRWFPGARIWDKARSTGLQVKDWQDVITVNMLGKRFYDETGPQFASNDWNVIKDYHQGDWHNAKNIKWNPRNWLNAAMAGIGDGKNGGGPIWAIFDAAAAEREKWVTEAPWVDYAEGFCFKADSIAELAGMVTKNKYQRLPMPPKNLEETVARYNSFVDSGKDEDFDKPTPKYKIAKGPFFAAWSTPVLHDTRAGLRINAKCQVVDLNGEVIPGLYCGGESAGGFSMHGIARATCQGYIAGHNAAAEKGREI
jgi:succinate dehydrogenase/fumarate reductase flavoprotein subunit